MPLNPSAFRGGYLIRDQFAHHFVTLSVCGWIDLFSRRQYRDIFLESISFCQRKKQLEVNAWVIMSNHVHMILRATGQVPLSDILRDLKKFTSRHMMQVVESTDESRRHWMLHQFSYYGGRHKKQQDYQIWTNDNHPESLYSSLMFDTKLEYIHQNPVRAGLVLEPQHYLYSSAIDYAGGKGLLDVVVL
jgi:putative transposase